MQLKYLAFHSTFLPIISLIAIKIFCYSLMTTFARKDLEVFFGRPYSIKARYKSTRQRSIFPSWDVLFHDCLQKLILWNYSVIPFYILQSNSENMFDSILLSRKSINYIHLQTFIFELYVKLRTINQHNLILSFS